MQAEIREGAGGYFVAGAGGHMLEPGRYYSSRGEAEIALERLRRFEQLRREWRIQLEHGGYSIPPGPAVCALERARDRLSLELLERDGRASIEWLPDDSEPIGEPDLIAETLERISSGEWEQAACIVTIDGATASLWGITGPAGDLYRRTVEAELAGELLGAAALEESCRTYWARRDLATVN